MPLAVRAAAVFSTLSIRGPVWHKTRWEAAGRVGLISLSLFIMVCPFLLLFA